MRIELHPANTQDFDYCRRIYFAEMERIIEELRLNIAWQEASFREQWQATQVRIITLDGSYIGWLQSFMQDDALLLCATVSRRTLSAQRNWHRGDAASDCRVQSGQSTHTFECCEDQSSGMPLRAARLSDCRRG